MTSANSSPVSADHSTANLLENHKRAVDRLNELSQDNRDIILKFDEINNVTFDNGLRTRTDKINCLYRACSWGDARLDLLLGGDINVGRKECEKIHAWVKGKYSKGHTIRNYVRRVKKVSQCVYKDPDSGTWEKNYELIEEEDFPKATRWLKYTVPAKEQRKSEKETLTRDEIDLIAGHLDPMSLLRSTAILYLCADTGARKSEVEVLCRSNFTFENGVPVTVYIPPFHESGWEVKTFERTIDLTTSRIPVQRWLSELDKLSDLEDPYFLSHTITGDPLISGMGRAMIPIKKAAERAGIDPRKRITPTGLRSSSATFLYDQGVPTAHLKQHHGWNTTSKMVNNYVVSSDNGVSDSILIANGMAPSSKAPPKPKIVTCYNCKQETPLNSKAAFCINCSVHLIPADRTPSAHEKLVNDIVEEMMNRQDAKDIPSEVYAEASGIIDELG